jgi:hypothetical protein
MGKVSRDDKVRIQTLREQGFGAKVIRSRYPEKGWNLSTISYICKRVDEKKSVVDRKPGSGRPKSARTADNIEKVQELICSQEDQPGTSKSTRQISGEVGISRRSVGRIARQDLGLTSFKRVPVQVLTDATKLRRLTRAKMLSRRLTKEKLKCVFFTDEKVFYLNPPISSQNNRVWSTGRKRDINPTRLLEQRAKFSQSVMVSAGVCYGGKGTLHFVHDKAKINADYYVNTLLPKLIEDCVTLKPGNFIFQQDGAPAHSSHLAQDWLHRNTPDFIASVEWPPNSPDLNPLDFHVWGAMLDKYQKHVPKPKNKDELKSVLKSIWRELPQQSIDKAILSFKDRLKCCITANGGHFEHLMT